MLRWASASFRIWNFETCVVGLVRFLETERGREGERGGGGEGRERVVKGCQECDRDGGNNCKLCENSPHANPCLHA